MTSAWKSKFEYWYTRCTPLSEIFKPTKEALEFLVLRSAPVEPEGFTAAFFAPNIIVDARGRVLIIGQADWDGIMQLGKYVLQLPQTGSFRNQWRVAARVTSKPIDRLLIRLDERFDETGVYGFSKEITVLQEPVGEYTNLPPPLFELTGLILEARAGYTRGEFQNRELVDEIKALILTGG